MSAFSPLTEGVPVGYVPDQDKYIAYSEYYGDGTIYGWREIIGPDGGPVTGKGKGVRQLIEMGAQVADTGLGAIAGALIQVPLEPQPEWIPLTEGMNVGYVAAEKVYIVYSEYYGGGTIYGRRAMTLPNGKPVKGEGKSVADLIKLEVVVSTQVLGSTNGDLVAVPAEKEKKVSTRFPSSKRRKPRGPGVN
jgi:hypothetical protein